VTRHSECPFRQASIRLQPTLATPATRQCQGKGITGAHLALILRAYFKCRLWKHKFGDELILERVELDALICREYPCST
jgi:hypothetical protein